MYRYRSIDKEGKNLQALSQNRLYFSTPANFNDPYDTLLFANSNKIVLNILTDIKNDPRFIIYPKDLLMEYIYKFVDNTKIETRENMKMVCFSESYDSMLMWSHYADFHKGYVVIYDIDDLKNAIFYADDGNLSDDEDVVFLDKVEYSERQTDLTDGIQELACLLLKLEKHLSISEYGTGIILDKLQQAVFQKSKVWSYEKEWRMVAKMRDVSEPSSVRYVECKPKGIILGAHCFGEEKNQLIKIAQKNNLPVYRMFLDEFDPSFKLNIGEGATAKII